jgi:Ca2+-binding EF-hand superfamily protein
MDTLHAAKREYHLPLDGVAAGCAMLDVVTDMQAIYFFYVPLSGQVHVWWGSLSLGFFYLTMRLFFLRKRFETNTFPHLLRTLIPFTAPFRRDFKYPLARPVAPFEWERDLLKDKDSNLNMLVNFVIGFVYLEVLGPVLGVPAFFKDQAIRIQSGCRFVQSRFTADEASSSAVVAPVGVVQASRGKATKQSNDSSSIDDAKKATQATVIALSEGVFEALPQLVIQSWSFFRYGFLPAETFYPSFVTSLLSIAYAVYAYTRRYAKVQDEEAWGEALVGVRAIFSSAGIPDIHPIIKAAEEAVRVVTIAKGSYSGCYSAATEALRDTALLRSLQSFAELEAMKQGKNNNAMSVDTPGESTVQPFTDGGEGDGEPRPISQGEDDPKGRANAQEVFDIFDEGKEGFIAIDDLGLLLAYFMSMEVTIADLEAVGRKFDARGEGVIDFDNTWAYIKQRKSNERAQGTIPRVVEQVFQAVIQLREAACKKKRNRVIRHVTIGCVTAEEFSETLRKLPGGTSEKDINVLKREIDRNGTGTAKSGEICVEKLTNVLATQASAFDAGTLSLLALGLGLVPIDCRPECGGAGRSRREPLPLMSPKEPSNCRSNTKRDRSIRRLKAEVPADVRRKRVPRLTKHLEQRTSEDFFQRALEQSIAFRPNVHAILAAMIGRTQQENCGHDEKLQIYLPNLNLKRGQMYDGQTYDDVDECAVVLLCEWAFGIFDRSGADRPAGSLSNVEFEEMLGCLKSGLELADVESLVKEIHRIRPSSSLIGSGHIHFKDLAEVLLRYSKYWGLPWASAAGWTTENRGTVPAVPGEGNQQEERGGGAGRKSDKELDGQQQQAAAQQMQAVQRGRSSRRELEGQQQAAQKMQAVQRGMSFRRREGRKDRQVPLLVQDRQEKRQVQQKQGAPTKTAAPPSPCRSAQQRPDLQKPRVRERLAPALRKAPSAELMTDL